ncbi:MAG: hypothetical protein LBI63_03300 [Candidatus Ancillula sp.]|jgi:uncharacterized repeat protein (TIGR02543 family)|nr:hypothetical protein [Candidatus Ancillula sp.]
MEKLNSTFILGVDLPNTCFCSRFRSRFCGRSSNLLHSKAWGGGSMSHKKTSFSKSFFAFFGAISIIFSTVFIGLPRVLALDTSAEGASISPLVAVDTNYQSCESGAVINKAINVESLADLDKVAKVVNDGINNANGGNATTITDNPLSILAAGCIASSRNDADITINLQSDIDLSSSSNVSGSAGWVPIGWEKKTDEIDRRFVSTFNGNGHKISNLAITRTYGNNQGLFGMVAKSGVIENLGVVGDIKVLAGNNLGAKNTGILAGVNDGIVENVWTSGKVLSYANVGGVIGVNNGKVSNIFSNATVELQTEITAETQPYTTENFGGLVGVNGYLIDDTGEPTQRIQAELKNSYFAGLVQGDKNTAGIAGYNVGIIDSVFSLGKVIFLPEGGTSTNIGGLVGKNEIELPEKSKLTNSVSLASVVAGKANQSSTINKPYTGRVSGYINGSKTVAQNNYALDVMGTDIKTEEDTSTCKLGELVITGQDQFRRYNGSYDTRPNYKEHDNINGQDISANDILSSNWFTRNSTPESPWTAWQNTSGWILESGKLPILAGIPVDIQTSAILETGYSKYSIYNPHFDENGNSEQGTADNPYLIKSAWDLAELACKVNSGVEGINSPDKYYQIENDIDLSALYGEGNTWTDLAGVEHTDGWQPIGGSLTKGSKISNDNDEPVRYAYTDYPFSANFDGKHHIIKNLHIDKQILAEDADELGTNINYGLFGLLQNTQDTNTPSTFVKNLGLTDVKLNFTATSSSKEDNWNGFLNVGAVAGGVYGYNISDVFATGKITLQQFNKNIKIGGLIGATTEGNSIHDVYSDVEITVADNAKVAAHTKGVLKNSIAGLIAAPGQSASSVNNRGTNTQISGSQNNVDCINDELQEKPSCRKTVIENAYTLGSISVGADNDEIMVAGAVGGWAGNIYVNPENYIKLSNLISLNASLENKTPLANAWVARNNTIGIGDYDTEAWQNCHSLSTMTKNGFTLDELPVVSKDVYDNFWDEYDKYSSILWNDGADEWEGYDIGLRQIYSTDFWKDTAFKHEVIQGQIPVVLPSAVDDDWDFGAVNETDKGLPILAGFTPGSQSSSKIHGADIYSAKFVTTDKTLVDYTGHQPGTYTWGGEHFQDFNADDPILQHLKPLEVNGYVFNGYFLDSEHTTALSDTYALNDSTGDITLYASWSSDLPPTPEPTPTTPEDSSSSASHSIGATGVDPKVELLLILLALGMSGLLGQYKKGHVLKRAVLVQ